VLAGCAAAITVLAIDSISEMALEGNSTAFAAWFLLGMATSLVRADPDLAGAGGQNASR
jgi:hypothetical protein